MKTLQIRNVPDAVHRALKARAAQEGKSLSELALEELTRSLERPTRREWLARLETHDPVELEPGLVASIIREERDGR